MSEMPSTPIAVPKPGDPDRKRALNVLAQRRYRQRRREKIQALETRVRSQPTVALQPPVIQSPISQSKSMQDIGMPTPAWSDAFFSQDGFANTIDNPTTQSEGLAFDLDAILNSSELPGSFNFDIHSSFPSPTSPDAELQNLELAQFTFPDDDVLEIPELRCMKAGFSIAETLGCVESMWDLTALRIFDKHSIPAATQYVPPNLQPTEAQRRLPHHPLFDIMPWPSVRNKLIVVFSQPLQFRPAIARDPLALMRLMTDIDDSAEGLRVCGDEWYDGDSWEVGQHVFQNWWFIFDQQVVDNSNALRRKRGANKLMLTP